MTKLPDFIILGTGGAFTFNVFKNLIEQGYKPKVYIQSGNKPQQDQTLFANIKLDIIQPQSPLSELLQLHNIPTYYQSQIKLQKFIIQQNIDFLLVACWPTLIPGNVIQAASKAALNLHPSLLPKFRGIDPIGDQLKTDDQNFGISLHLISETYDTGDIVLQKPLNIEMHMDKNTIEIEAANIGANLFIRAINNHKQPGWNLVKQLA